MRGSPRHSVPGTEVLAFSPYYPDQPKVLRGQQFVDEILSEEQARFVVRQTTVTGRDTTKTSGLVVGVPGREV